MHVTTNNNSLSAMALSGLKQVIDPEIGLNIVDLGLIFQIDFDEDARNIYCTMTLTTQFCPMGESISHAAEKTLQATFPNYEIILKLIFNPAWNQEMISEEGRQYLNR